MNQLAIDFAAAASVGIQRALTHAAYIDDEWPELALAFLRRYAQRNPEFTVEQMTAAADLMGYGSPTTGKAWGGIVRKASSLKLIRYTGRTAPRVKGHGAPGPVWESLVCVGAAA